MTDGEVIALFAPFAPVTARKMFGGLGIYCEGVIFALVAQGELFMKVDGENEALFTAAGSTPFVYEGKGKPVAMRYFRLPADAYDDEAALVRYAAAALAAGHRAGAARSRKGRRQ